MNVYDYFDEVQSRPFEWGTHDCFTFTNEAWTRMHGKPWAPPEWFGAYLATDGCRPRLLVDLAAAWPGHATIGHAIDTVLQPVRGIPPRGALCACYAGEGRARLGIGLGIADGTSGAFLGRHGLLFRPISEISAAWVCK